MWRIDMKDKVRPAAATAWQHHAPNIHSPVTVVTALKIITTTIVKSVSAKLSSMKFVFVRRWRNFVTEIQIKEFPTTVANMISTNTVIWTATSIVSTEGSLVCSPSAIVIRFQDKSLCKINSLRKAKVNTLRRAQLRTSQSWENRTWPTITVNRIIITSCWLTFIHC